jgi:uncharacterized membrane protein YphA (DoxX/SURF4 family)
MRIINVCIALVWLVNGLYCKVLNYVPRHQLIVARILGDDYAGILTKMIGVSEMGMAIWVLSGIWKRLCAVAQIVLVATMNIIEFILAPDLLLFGRINILIATIFITVIFLNEFIIVSKRSSLPGRSLL